MTEVGSRDLREAAAEKYKPDRIRLLLIAEAPPRATDRYFYFPEVAIHDSLFRYTARLVLGVEPARTNKAEILSQLRDAGVFLIDLCRDPVIDKSELKACVEDLIRRASALQPDNIILIKATVYDTAVKALQAADLPVVDRMIPFPGSGQQLRFEQEMRLALEWIQWSPSQAGPEQ
jgi:hypothetical protein